MARSQSNASEEVVRLASQIAFLLLVGVTAFAVPDATAHASDAKKIVTPVGEVISDGIELHEVRSGVWIHTSYYTYPDGTRFPANGLIVREGDGLLLVDTAWGELLTLALLERIKVEIGLPVHRAVVTHSHYDRVAGADVLEARGVEVRVHPLALGRTIGQGMPVPNNTLIGLDTPGASVRLGPVEVFYPGPGHAPDNLMVWVPSERVLFGGCAVRAVTADSLGARADADMGAWPGAIRRARARYTEAEVVVPGHGKVGGPELLDHTLRLFKGLPEGGN
jgi:metallo-beta-lactamase class B VIM